MTTLKLLDTPLKLDLLSAKIMINIIISMAKFVKKYSLFRSKRLPPLGGRLPWTNFFRRGARGRWKSTDQSISDMCRDMPEYP